MSVNHRRMKRMSRSSTSAMTSSWVSGWAVVAMAPRTLLARRPLPGQPGRPFCLEDPLHPGRDAPLAEPAIGPELQLAQRGLELPAHLRERELDPQRRTGDDRA